MATLVHIPYSPWSRRASLALRRMGVATTSRVFTPVLSEPWLRAKLRRPWGRITLPVLLRPDAAPLTDSWDIVAWGHQHAAQGLLPAAHRPAIRAWADRADRAMEAGRVRTAHRVLHAPAALQASLPPPIGSLGPLGRAIGRDATHRLLKKYPCAPDEGPLRRLCEAVDDALAHTGNGTLLGVPTYADLAVACALAFVQPDRTSGVPRDAQACWTEPDLVAAHGDVLAWRDRTVQPQSGSGSPVA